MKNILFLLISGLFAFYIMDYSFKNDPEEKDKYPDEFAFIKRTYPYYAADNDVYLQAFKQLEVMKSQKLSKVNNAAWEFAGPINIGGRVVDIEFNPVNPQIVYAASATGGVFKSTNKGVDWFPVFDKQATLTIGNIALDPINPDIIYVGTGEPNGGHNNFTGSGVFKSTDAGATWIFLGLQNTHSIGRVLVDPVNTNNIYVAATGSYFGRDNDRGIYKSTDAGTTWNQSLFVTDSTAAIDIIIAPDNPQVLYAAMWERYRTPHLSHLNGPTSGIYKTTDGGTTWNKFSTASGFPQNGVGRIGLSISQQNSNIIYALVNTGTEYMGLYKTINGGNNWINVDGDRELESGYSNFSWYFGQVRVDPSNDNIIYALDVAFMKSTDGGSTWPIIYGYSGPQQLHVDHHALAFAPDDPNYLLSGNDGGMNISTNKGVSWSNPVQLPATQFYEIGLDWNNPQKLYGGTQDNSTIRTQTGALDDWEIIYGGDGFYTLVNFSNPDIIYAESQFGDLGKSTNGGATFNYAMNGINFSEPTNWSTPVIMDFNNTDVLYYGTNKIYRTTNGAQSWSAISPKLTISPDGARLGTITTIAVSPSNPGYIYCGTDDGQVWVTFNNGASWTNVSAGLPNRWVTRVAVNPNEPNKIYVTFSGLKWRDPQPHVFKSTDLGQNWIDISSNLPDAPVDAFVVDNNNPSTLYLGNDVGAFVSYNDGEQWEILGEGLPVVVVNDLKIHPNENYLAAGTHGRGIWKININPVTDVKDKNIVQSFGLEQNYPNPFNPSTTIEFNITERSSVNLTIYNLQGEVVDVLFNKEMQPGKHKAEWNTTNKNLASGIYFYKLKAGNQTETRKMILMK